MYNVKHIYRRQACLSFKVLIPSQGRAGAWVLLSVVYGCRVMQLGVRVRQHVLLAGRDDLIHGGDVVVAPWNAADRKTASSQAPPAVSNA